MKILFYIDSLYSGGKERRLIELIQGLSKFPNYEMQLVLSKKEIHYKQIHLTGIRIHYIERNRLKKDPIVFYKFYKIAKKFKPDFIHVWNYVEAVFAIPTKLILRIPMINNQITSSPINVSKSLFRHKLTFAFSDKILANSYAGIEAYKEIMSDSVLKNSKVIYNGFDFDRILNLEDASIMREKFNIKTEYIIGMVANFSYKKDYDTYIKAANLVLEKEKNVTFICVGSGDSNKYKQMVLLKNKNKILFLGKQKDIESIMNICNIGVLASFTEGISNSLLEFMALEKPVIVAGEGGCKELVSDNQNGYLLEIGDFHGLANKILYLIENEDTLNMFKKNSKNIVSEKFNITTMIDEFKLVYQNLYK